MRTMQDLYQMQGLPLNLKIRMTKERIRQWINTYGEDGVYVSFSGGKDSTVLLDLVRQDYPRVKAVFVDTGLEYPEIRQFVKTFDNVEWLKPKMTFKQVIKKYGYPFISKEVSECVYGARKYLTHVIAESSLDRPTDRPIPYKYWYERVTGTGAYRKHQTGQTSSIPVRNGQNTRPVSPEIRGGGYDNKWRKARGIGEYSKRPNDSQKGRSESAACDHVRDANERQGSSDKGEYP